MVISTFVRGAPPRALLGGPPGSAELQLLVSVSGLSSQVLACGALPGNYFPGA
jgi:hypothetical protein